MLALAESVEDLGARVPTVSEVIDRAGISRRTFYEHFGDREEALLAAVQESVARAAARVLPAYRAQTEWRDAIRAGLAGLLAFLEEEPAFGSLLLLDALGRPLAEDPGLRRRVHLQALLDALDGGRELARSAAGLSRANAEAVLGGVLFILRARMLEGQGRAMSSLLGELMSVIVRPYLGAAAAAREARRPAPAASASAAPDWDGTPLGKVDVRLTMRTVLVLRRIAEHPGSSNSRIAALADIGDQGQASKLLARLQTAGLIENVGGRSPRGRPNAWHLAAEGRRLMRGLSAGRGARM
jgi:AcrR family transcriptional regulator